YSRKLVRISDDTSMSTMRSSKSSGGGAVVRRAMSNIVPKKRQCMRHVPGGGPPQPSCDPTKRTNGTTSYAMSRPGRQAAHHHREDETRGVPPGSGRNSRADLVTRNP